MIDGKNVFDQPIKCKNIRKIAIGQGDDYTTGFLLDYTLFRHDYKMTVVDLSKEQAS